MQVKSIAECSKGSILQYFRPLLSYHLSLRSLFCLFLSGRFTQVLLYLKYIIWCAVNEREDDAIHTIVQPCRLVSTQIWFMCCDVTYKYITSVTGVKLTPEIVVMESHVSEK